MIIKLLPQLVENGDYEELEQFLKFNDIGSLIAYGNNDIELFDAVQCDRPLLFCGSCPEFRD